MAARFPIKFMPFRLPLLLRFSTVSREYCYSVHLETASMDITWITDRIALGGGIWNDENMAELVRMGISHVINMQIEFDDEPLAEPYGVMVLHNPTDDDFQRSEEHTSELQSQSNL